ncbi:MULTISPECIES: monooxygenase [unclassified Serratia (in: enterobacteria)]|uniref:monooxygenase n=1 Tax=unclassified Serratia (in: enterobacteria) TaxID=2647522 RepID=UPI0005025D16|nr:MULTISPECIES: monooxygenase [unclassified Serratia (in: enterobacteria)]KFK96593.1 monooxygenase [Serratia sp. Ag2]KFK99787.1 monooxygenase [Serratia sp. Ag1]
MYYILQVDFPYTGPWGTAMHQAMEELARSISLEPGFIWKYWTENQETHEAGGIYLFRDEKSAATYLEKHASRLKSFGIPHVNGKIFSVNEALSRLNHAPF